MMSEDRSHSVKNIVIAIFFVLEGDGLESLLGRGYYLGIVVFIYLICLLCVYYLFIYIWYKGYGPLELNEESGVLEGFSIMKNGDLGENSFKNLL